MMETMHCVAKWKHLRTELCDVRVAGLANQVEEDGYGSNKHIGEGQPLLA
jgi:hypothetical protein